MEFVMETHWWKQIIFSTAFSGKGQFVYFFKCFFHALSKFHSLFFWTFTMDGKYLCEVFDVFIMGKRSVEQHNIGKIHKALEATFWYLTTIHWLSRKFLKKPRGRQLEKLLLNLEGMKCPNVSLDIVPIRDNAIVLTCDTSLASKEPWGW